MRRCKLFLQLGNRVRDSKRFGPVNADRMQVLGTWLVQPFDFGVLLRVSVARRHRYQRWISCNGWYRL